MEFELGSMSGATKEEEQQLMSPLLQSGEKQSPRDSTEGLTVIQKMLLILSVIAVFYGFYLAFKALGWI